MDIKFNEKNPYLKPLCEVLNVEMYHPLAGTVEGQAPDFSGGDNEQDKPD